MLKFRIIALGTDFEKSNRRSLLCQALEKDELGFDTLGRQFQWEINKEGFTKDHLTKLQAVVDKKEVLTRNMRLVEVTRQNPETGEIVVKTICESIS